MNVALLILCSLESRDSASSAISDFIGNMLI